jgi:hypothetical protein
MDFGITTPALLFPAISLLLLAYTNRFLALASLVRELHAKWEERPEKGIAGQIANLKKRIRIIKLMQLFGVSSFFLCVLVMLLLFAGALIPGEIAFALSLVFLLASLGLSVRELAISADALDILLKGDEGGSKG